ncbi:MAG: GNAT family N-acetyltransferase [Clostridiales bacterium]
MAENNIEFRPIEKADYKYLEEIIKDTWGYERFCTPKTAKKLSRVFLASCLTNQTFTLVALNNQVPVGVILGKNEKKHRSKLKYQLRLITSVVGMILSKEGRQTAGVYKNIEKIDKELLAGSGTEFDGELAFFAVRSDQRGNGVGKVLFEKFKAYMQGEKTKNFYLFTDTTCNYGFYEAMGLKRLGEKKFSLKPQWKEDIMFFIYGCEF